MMRPNGGAGGIWGDEPLPDQDDKELAPPAAPQTDADKNDGEPVRKKVKRETEAEAEAESQSRSEAGEGASGRESDDDGPPVEASSRVPVMGLFPEAEAVEKAVPSGRPSIHPSRLAAQDEGEGGAQVDADADAARSKAAKTIVCRYFKTGKCHQGEQCPFLHIVSNRNSRRTVSQRCSLLPFLWSLPPPPLADIAHARAPAQAQAPRPSSAGVQSVRARRPVRPAGRARLVPPRQRCPPGDRVPRGQRLAQRGRAARGPDRGGQWD